MIGAKAVIFQGKKTAAEVLDKIEERMQDHHWIEDVAIISRSKRGLLKVHSTWAQDDSNVADGFGWGALTGGLIGALVGPAGALTGALGGASIGGLLGIGITLDLEDPRLQRFAEGLGKDKSALILLADGPTLAEFGSAVARFEGTLVDITLSEKEVNALRHALKR